MNKKNNRKGFTIVELVIVIAVIAILATVLVPTFGTVIADAKETAAKQEAKNIYTNYVMANAKTGTYESDVVVLVDGYYVTVEDGAAIAASTTAPTTCYEKLDPATLTVTSVHSTTSCTHRE